MYLDALDHPKESFKVTAVGIVANVALNIILIPIIGISGAAMATLATMTLNALLAKRALSKLITIRLERHSLSNIAMASVAMGMIVGGHRLVLPLSSIGVTLMAVTIGGMTYGILVLKLDRKICDELREIVEKVGIGFVWPGWLGISRLFEKINWQIDVIVESNHISLYVGSKAADVPIPRFSSK